MGKCNKIWKSDNGFGYLIAHLKKYHHTDEGIRKMLNRKYCGHHECNELIQMDLLTCGKHKNMNLDAQMISEVDPSIGAVQSNLVQQDIYSYSKAIIVEIQNYILNKKMVDILKWKNYCII